MPAPMLNDVIMMPPKANVMCFSDISMTLSLLFGGSFGLLSFIGLGPDSEINLDHGKGRTQYQVADAGDRFDLLHCIFLVVLGHVIPPL